MKKHKTEIIFPKENFQGEKRKKEIVKIKFKISRHVTELSWEKLSFKACFSSFLFCPENWKCILICRDPLRKFVKTSSPNHIFSSHHAQCRWEGKKHVRRERWIQVVTTWVLTPAQSAAQTGHGGLADKLQEQSPSCPTGQALEIRCNFSDRSIALEMLVSDLPCFLLQPPVTSTWIRWRFGHPGPVGIPMLLPGLRSAVPGQRCVPCVCPAAAQTLHSNAALLLGLR